jgi:hypothetical protein
MLTIEGIAKKTHRKVTDKDVITFVESTNAYRKMWPGLLKEAEGNYNSPEHNRLLKLEKSLYRTQKRSGRRLGILAPEPPPEKDWKENKK